MNLVWLAKKPSTMNMSGSEGFVTAPLGGIRMRVHRVTEVHSDTWRSRTHQSDNGMQDEQNVFQDKDHPKADPDFLNVKSPESPSPTLSPAYAV
jgi:hypothetical protein